MGIAECTPKTRASYEAVATTPRGPRPPTTTAFPRRLGLDACSTEAKKASMSRCRIVGADLTSPMLPYATDNGRSRTVSDGLVPPPCQLVHRVVSDQGLPGVDALPVQLGQRALHVPPHHAHGDAEDALATLEQSVDLVGRGALVDRGAVAHQRHALQVAETALTQVLDRGADVLQG